jgi:NAD(P)-dependent dehydrogenase (short-subunit alcohol dehydrogenase family)
MDGAGETERAIQALGQRCVALHADVSDEGAVQRMVAVAVQRFGGLDILVNNAGIALFKPIEAFTPAEFSHVIDVNLKGPWLCAKYALPELKRRRGTIINITSASGHYGGASAGGSAYDASKAGLQQLTYSLAAEFGPHGIRVNAIAPGVIVTDRLEGQGFVASEVGRQEIGRTPLRRFGTPAEVGSVAVFLASDDASYINGTTIILDGGSMAVW